MTAQVISDLCALFRCLLDEVQWFEWTYDIQLFQKFRLTTKVVKDRTAESDAMYEHDVERFRISCSLGKDFTAV